MMAATDTTVANVAFLAICTCIVGSMAGATLLLGDVDGPLARLLKWGKKKKKKERQ